MFQKIFDELSVEYQEVKEAFQNGNLVKALEICKEKKDEESVVLEGIILIILRKYLKAISTLENINLDKLNLISVDIFYELLGLCYYEEKNYLEATKNFIKALEYNKQNFYAKYNLSNIYILKKDYKRAYEYLLDLKKIEPTNENIIKNLKLLEKFL